MVLSITLDPQSKEAAKETLWQESYSFIPSTDIEQMKANARHSAGVKLYGPAFLTGLNAQDRDLFDNHITSGIQTDEGGSFKNIAKKMLGYVSPVHDPDFQTHLARHTQQPALLPIKDAEQAYLTIGSKFPATYNSTALFAGYNRDDLETLTQAEYKDMVRDAITRTPIDIELFTRHIDQLLRQTYVNLAHEGQTPGRVVLKGQIAESQGQKSGLDPLIELKKDQNYIELVRDAGTPNETIIKVVPVENNDSIPSTKDVQVIAGPYGNSGKWGVYTVFAGQDAPAFPNAHQSPEQRAANEKFWNNHGFLATPEQIEFTVAQMKSELKVHPEKSGIFTPMILSAEKVTKAHQAPERGGFVPVVTEAARPVC